MAVRFDSSTEKIGSTSGMPSSTAYTACGWAYHETDTNGYTTLWTIASTPGYGDPPYNWIGTEADGSAWYVDTGFGVSDFSSDPGFNVWFHWYMTCSGTGASDLKAGWRFVGDTSYVSISRAGTSKTYTEIEYCGDTNSLLFNGRAAAFKLWGKAKPESEIFTESYFYQPVDYDSLNRFTPLFQHTDLKDYSGSALDYSATGTLATEDGPPIAWSPIRLRHLVSPAPPPAGGLFNLKMTGIGR